MSVPTNVGAMATTNPTAQLRSATVEVLAKVIKISRHEDLPGLYATVWPMVRGMNRVCHRYESMEKREDIVETILAGHGTVALGADSTGEKNKELVLNPDTKDTSDMYLFEKGDARRTENSFLNHQNELLHREIKDLEVSKDLEVVKLREHNVEVQRKVELAYTDINRLHALNDDLRKRCSDDEALLQEKEKTIEEKDAAIGELQADKAKVMMDMGADISDRDAQIRELKAQTQAAKSTLAGQTHEIVSLHRQIADHQPKSDDAAQREIGRLRKAYRELRISSINIAIHQARIAHKDATIQVQADDVEEGTKKLEETRKLLLEAGVRINQYTTALAAASGRVQILQRRMAFLDDQGRQLGAACHALNRAEGGLLAARAEIRRLRRRGAAEVASSSSRHERRWVESEDEDEGVEEVLGALLRASFTRTLGGLGH